MNGEVHLVYEDQCYSSATFRQLRFMPFQDPAPAHPPDVPFSWRWTYLGTLQPEERVIRTPTGKSIPILPTPSFELKLGKHRFLVHEGAFVAKLLVRRSFRRGIDSQGKTLMGYEWELAKQERTVVGISELMADLERESSSMRKIVLSCYGTDFVLAEKNGSPSPRPKVSK